MKWCWSWMSEGQSRTPGTDSDERTSSCSYLKGLFGYYYWWWGLRFFTQKPTWCVKAFSWLRDEDCCQRSLIRFCGGSGTSDSPSCPRGRCLSNAAVHTGRDNLQMFLVCMRRLVDIQIQKEETNGQESKWRGERDEERNGPGGIRKNDREKEGRKDLIYLDCRKCELNIVALICLPINTSREPPWPIYFLFPSYQLLFRHRFMSPARERRVIGSGIKFSNQRVTEVAARKWDFYVDI